VTATRSAERDTVAVDDAPADDGMHLPFSSVGGALRWWFGPSVGREHWSAAWYLVVGVLWSIVMFVATLTAMSVTFSLVFVVVGLLLVMPTFALVDAMVSVERRRAEWLGRRIEPRTHRSRTGGWWRSIGAALTDPERWRQVGFVVAFIVVAPVLFGLALVPWAMILVVVIGAVSGLGGVDVLDVLFAVVLLGVAPRLTLVVARSAATFVAWFLGRDPTAELAGRVEELSVQRAEILEAVAAERRRIERNLHDGVQQQLVALGIDIGRAQARLDDDPEAARALLDEARETLRAAIGEMRVIGRGLHPAVLEDRGLDAALSSIVAASPIPITIDVGVTADLPADAAATAYYVVSEAVANIHKHAHARVASVTVTDDAPGSIRIVVHDDGRGGADPSHGTGLAGMKARVEGVDGTLRIDSLPGGPTTLEIVLPVIPLDRAPARRS
jgi:signal transduction histidine kinase